MQSSTFETGLSFSFNNILSEPLVLPNGMKLNSLLCADDLTVLSRSKVGLQNCLNTLSLYCNSWMLKINPTKTKIMIFQKFKRKCVSSFYTGNEKIDIVQNYTYLGTCISSSGNFTFSVDHLDKRPSMPSLVWDDTLIWSETLACVENVWLHDLTNFNLQ